MEAVPRLPMISFDLKVSPEPSSFAPKLKQYIRDFYNEDPESYSNEIHQLESLRATAVRPPIDVNGCSLLKKYYCQLHFLQSRFPMGSDGAAAVTFTWRDTYANMVYSLANIRFEIISILYNIGAVHTQLGSNTERTSAEGMKMACAHFQCAAWAFDHLKNTYPQPPGVDLAPELMTFMHQLCLAQAQECILEKSMLDNRKATIVAKVATQIVDYYNLALNTLEQGGNDDGSVCDTVGSKIYKSWKRYVRFKKLYYLAVSQLYQGQSAEEQQKMGERVAFYNASLLTLTEARTLYTSNKGGGIMNTNEDKEAVEDALTFTNDVIEGKRKAAKNENEFIYHEEVPDRDALPPIKGASLVKGIPFDVNDPEVSGPDIFSRLVPMKVHEASSLYSEEKAKVLRSVGAKIEERDQQLITYLASLRLEHLSLWDPDNRDSSNTLALPDELAERCAALNAKPTAIQDLVDAMGKLADTYHDVEAMLKDIDELLAHEKTRETEYQVVLGKRPPSIVATDLTREANKYQEAHAKASESNEALHRAMTMHVNNLRILAQPLAELMAHIPSPKNRASGNDAADRENDIITRELKRILGKVDEMRRQRSELHAQLRDSIAQDDLTRLLVTASTETGSLDRLFAEQISKHNRLISLIEQNLAAQDNILTALTDVYARSADSRKSIDEVLKLRNNTIKSLISSYDAYEDLLAKSSKGLEFYRKLETNVAKLLQRVKSTCKVQEEEREQILARNNKTSAKSSEFMNTGVAPEEPAPTSGGLKLKDYLASRQKGVSASVTPSYQNPYYNQHVSQSGSPQPLPAVRPAPVGQEGNDATSSLPSDSSDSGRNYQYPAGYADYYTAQRGASEPPHAYGHYVDYTAGLNSSHPKSGTTNTASTYHQANGSTDTTEVTSFNGQYPNYSTTLNEQTRYPQNIQGQYPSASTQLQYNSTGYGQYPGYTYPEQSYMPQSSVSSQDGQPVIHSAIEKPATSHGAMPTNQGINPQNQPHFQSNKSMYGEDQRQPVPAGLVQRQDQQIAPQATNVSQPQLSQSQQIAGQIRQYETQNTQLQQSLQEISQRSSQITTPSKQIPAQNYAVNQQIVSQYQALVAPHPQTVPQTQQIPAPDSSTLQAHENPQISSDNAPVMLSAPLQYPQSQYSGAVANSSGQQYGMYGSSSYTGNLYPPGIHQNQQGYSNSTTSQHQQIQSQLQSLRGQPIYQEGAQSQQSDVAAAGAVQGQNTEVTQSYPDGQQSYGSYQNLYGSGYQPQSTQNSTISQSYAAGSYPNHSEIIQSHAKSAPSQSYPQNYQYSAQGQYRSSMQYQSYPQGYQTGYSATQAPNDPSLALQTDSYKGHPGYTYDPATGGYQYSSGYQNSQTAQPESSNIGNGNAIVQQNPAYSNYVPQDKNTQYTIASNNSSTNHTPSSQYNQQSYQTPNYNQAYYTPPYGHQGQETSAETAGQKGQTQTYMQATNNATNTTTSPSVENGGGVPADGPKSNVDLLADLEFSINHAPLVPEVNTTCKTDVEVLEAEKILKPSPKVEDLSIKQETESEAVSKTEEKVENLQIVWDTWYNDVQPKKDPLGDPQALQKFAYDVEKYEKFMDGLLTKTLSGATTLDIKWKEVRDFQEREAKKQTTAVALSHGLENRSAGSIPYDSSRVELSTPDLYINASHVKDITPCIPVAFIVTQAPTPKTLTAFWTMIWEQECEVIACLASNSQLNNEIYWPATKGEDLTVENFTLSLESSMDHTTYVQRIISIKYGEKKTSRIVVHMQFTMWPINGYPSSPGPLLTFSNDTLSEQALRRSRRPIVVHCVEGSTLSGLFLIAVASVCNVRAGRGLVDAGLVFSTLVRFRKSLVDQDSLLFSYRMILYHAQDTLMKRGILSSSRSTFECFDGNKSRRGKSKIQQRHPSDDFLHNLAAGMLRTPQDFIPGGTKGISESLSTTTEKLEESKPVDPLSQLDPLWSIRK